HHEVVVASARVVPSFAHSGSLSSLRSAAAATATYPLSLHDALPIYGQCRAGVDRRDHRRFDRPGRPGRGPVQPRLLRKLPQGPRSEEHTSELQSRENLVCRLLLEKKKPLSVLTSLRSMLLARSTLSH